MRTPATQITLLNNSQNFSEAGINNIITRYNTEKNKLDNKLSTSSADQKSIMLSFNKARTHLVDILHECQNNQGIRAIIAVQFNKERKYLIEVATEKGYSEITLAALTEPPQNLDLKSGPQTDFDPNTVRRKIIRAVSLGVGVTSLGGLGLGLWLKITSQASKVVIKEGIKEVAKEGIIESVKAITIPIVTQIGLFPFVAAAGSSVVVGSATYFDLRPRQSGTLPNIVVAALNTGGM